MESVSKIERIQIKIPDSKLQITKMNITINTTNANFGNDYEFLLKDAKPYRKAKQMECFIENYPYKYGKREDELKNKKIVKLARKYKFYWETIQGIIDPSKRGGICFGNTSRQVATARIKNKIVGFIIYSTPEMGGKYNTTSSVDYWIVDKDFRGYGIGKQLFDAYLNGHSQCGGHNRWVNFHRGDEELEKLYTKMGYKEIEKYGGTIQDTRKMEWGERQCKEHHKWWFIKITHLTYNHPDSWFYPCEDTKFNRYRGSAVRDVFENKEDPYYIKGYEDKVSYEWFVKFSDVLTAIKRE